VSDFSISLGYDLGSLGHDLGKELAQFSLGDFDPFSPVEAIKGWLKLAAQVAYPAIAVVEQVQRRRQHLRLVAIRSRIEDILNEPVDLRRDVQIHGVMASFVNDAVF
jgi:hypothetical protein